MSQGVVERKNVRVEFRSCFSAGTVTFTTPDNQRHEVVVKAGGQRVELWEEPRGEDDTIARVRTLETVFHADDRDLRFTPRTRRQFRGFRALGLGGVGGGG